MLTAGFFTKNASERIALVVLSFVVVYLVAKDHFPRDRPNHTILEGLEAKSLVIRGSVGSPSITLESSDHSASIRMYLGESTPRLELTLNRSRHGEIDETLIFRNTDTSSKTGLILNNDGLSELQMIDRSGSGLISIRNDYNDSKSMLFRNNNRKQIEFTAHHDDLSEINLYDKDEKESIRAIVPRDGPRSLEISGRNPGTRLRLACEVHDLPAISLYQSDKKTDAPRISLAIDEKNNARYSMSNSSGKTGLAQTVFENGSSSIALFNQIDNKLLLQLLGSPDYSGVKLFDQKGHSRIDLITSRSYPYLFFNDSAGEVLTRLSASNADCALTFFKGKTPKGVVGNDYGMWGISSQSSLLNNRIFMGVDRDKITRMEIDNPRGDSFFSIESGSTPTSLRLGDGNQTRFHFGVDAKNQTFYSIKDADGINLPLQ